MNDLASLWKEAARRLAAEDSRFAGLDLSMVRVGEIQKLVAHGRSEAVDLLLSTTVNFRVALKSVLRKAAEDAGGWEADLATDTWPMFDLAPASEVEPEEAAPAPAAANPPLRPPGPAPLLQGETQPAAFRRLAQELGELVVEKNRAYGNSFNETGDMLRILYPGGISPDQYDDALAVVRILDKLKRIATDRDALGESPFRDVAGYGLLGLERVERGRKG